MSLFTYPIKVNASHIDRLNHVNNEVYLKWLLEAASAHSTALGYGMERYLKEESVFVVRRHEIEYLMSAYLDEELVVETWIKDIAGARTTRAYRIKRMSDQKTLVTAETLWVYISMKTGKPQEIPPAMARDFLPSN
jgi:acyl-CoA thioester hydrolase